MDLCFCLDGDWLFRVPTQLTHLGKSSGPGPGLGPGNARMAKKVYCRLITSD